MTEIVRVLYVTASVSAGEGAEALEDAGLTVIEARSAVDAMKRLEDDPVDCVVCDISLPDMDAVGFVGTVRSRDPTIPIFFVGEPEEPGRISRLLSAGATGFIAGIEPAVVERIRSAVGERVTGRELDRHRRLKDAVREISVALTEADSREGIEAAVHRRLSAGGLYRFVWVGSYDPTASTISLRQPVDDVLTPGELAGVVGCESDGFVEETARSGEIQVVDGSPDLRRSATAPDDVTSLPESGLDVHDSACIVVPFGDGESVVDVAVLVADGPTVDEAERQVLLDLGRVVGNALETVEADETARERTERFVKQLVHELRNPLGIAMTHLQVARETEDPASLDEVQTALAEMDRAISGVMTLVREDAVTNPTPGDLGEDARAAWETIDAEDATLVVDDSGEIVGDHDLVVRMLSNLFLNAIEHDGDGVTVRVGTLDDGFYVEDDGRGIPVDRRDEVFEWGFSTTESTGIGLSIVKAIADLHGWSVAVAGADEGGARFEVTGVTEAPPARTE